MSEGDGCAGVIFFVVVGVVAALWANVAIMDAREAEARRSVCLERGGYYYEPGLIFRDSVVYCMERPIPVDITPNGGHQ